MRSLETGRELRRVAKLSERLAVGQGRDAQGGRCLPAVLGIFVHGSRPLESGGKGTARKVGRAREVSEGGVEIARREATDVRVNAITLHLCSKLS